MKSEQISIRSGPILVSFVLTRKHVYFYYIIFKLMTTFIDLLSPMEHSLINKYIVINYLDFTRKDTSHARCNIGKYFNYSSLSILI